MSDYTYGFRVAESPRTYGSGVFLNPPAVPAYAERYAEQRAAYPSMPSYNPASVSLTSPDEAHENWMRDIDLAKEEGSVAEFAMHKIPAYRSKILTAMGNRDYTRVEALDKEISDFVEKNREGLQPWANLQRSGPQGAALSAQVNQILDGSYKDVWTMAPQGQGAQGQSMRAFLDDNSDEARDSRARTFAQKRGMATEVARAITDEMDALHSLFAKDKDTFAEFDKAQGLNLADDDRARMASDWVQTKWNLAHDKDAASAFAGEDGNLDVRELNAFLSTWENNLSRTKNGGISIIKDAIASYKELKDSENPVRPETFVQDFARFQGGLTRTVTTVNDKGIVTSQQPSPVSMAQAIGLASKALSVGKKLGLSPDRILRNSAVQKLLADANAETQSLRDFGFDIYSSSDFPNDDIVETVFAKVGLPGAEDKMSFYYDGVKALNNAVMTRPDIGSVPTTSADGTPQFTQDSSLSLAPLELPVRKALATSIASQRQGNESWKDAVARITSSENGMALVKDAVKKSLPNSTNPILLDALADAYIGNLVGRPGGSRVSAVQVLQDFAFPDQDEDGAPAPTLQETMRKNGVLLGTTVQRPVPVEDRDAQGKVTKTTKLESVELSASDKNVAATLAANPDEVLPPVDGDTKEVKSRFKSIGELLGQSSTEDRDRYLEREVAKAIAVGGEAPRVDDVNSFLDFKGHKRHGVLNTPADECRMTQFIDDTMNLADTASRPDASLKDILWLAQSYSRAQDGLLAENLGILGSAAVNRASSRQLLRDHRRPGETLDDVYRRLKKAYPSSDFYGVRIEVLRQACAQVLGTHGFLDNGKFNMKSGLLHLSKEFPEESAKSALFATLTGGDGKFNADAYIAHEQKRRLASVYRKPEPAVDVSPEEVALQTEARRMLQVYGESAVVPKKLWDHCVQQSCGDPRAANMMYGRLAEHYVQKRERKGQATADQWLGEVTKRRFRYFPVVNPETGQIQTGVVNRSDQLMTNDEYEEQIQRINESRHARGLDLIPRSTLLESDAAGPYTWKAMEAAQQAAAKFKAEQELKNRLEGERAIWVKQATEQ